MKAKQAEEVRTCSIPSHEITTCTSQALRKSPPPGTGAGQAKGVTMKTSPSGKKDRKIPTVTITIDDPQDSMIYHEVQGKRYTRKDSCRGRMN